MKMRFMNFKEFLKHEIEFTRDGREEEETRKCIQQHAFSPQRTRVNCWH